MPSGSPMCGRNSHITLAVSEADVWAEWLHQPCSDPSPCVSGMATSPLLHHPCCLGGPCVGGMATNCLHHPCPVPGLCVRGMAT